MNKHLKQRNWEKGTEELQILVAKDYDVQPFSDIHFRINRRLDVWPSTKSYYDLITGRKGKYEELGIFVPKFFAEFLKIVKN